MNTVLRLPVVRQRIIEELSALLLPRGYKGYNRRGENYFMKKRADGYIQWQFLYSDSFPLSYEVYSHVTVCQQEIQSVRTSFYASIPEIPFYSKENLFFSEGDFVEALKNSRPKYKHGYKHLLKVPEDLEAMMRWYRSFAEYELVQLEERYVSLASTHAEVNAQRQLALEHAMHGGMLETHLISGWLSGDLKYDELLTYYTIALKAGDPVPFADQRAADILVRLDLYLKEHVTRNQP